VTPDALARKWNIEEKKMLGCICFLLNGNVLAGVWKDLLIARLGPDQGEDALLEAASLALSATCAVALRLTGEQI